MRGYWNTSAGKATALVLAILGTGGALYSIRASFGQSEAAAIAQDRTFICAQTNRTFRHRLQISDTLPVTSPYSGKSTGYPAELCYWTRSGQVKQKPTAVLLNRYRGQPEPTFCPDCDRLVQPHNPAPDPASHPPPTRSEYLAGLQRAAERRR